MGGNVAGVGSNVAVVGHPLQRRASLLLSLLLLVLSSMATCEPQGLTSDPSDHFLYFGYGSNLLRERLQLRNPSASFVSVGHVQNYTLGFGYWSKDFSGDDGWHGGMATMEERPGEQVWGVVWRMGREHLGSLDEQEGVPEGYYRPLEVNVSTAEGVAACRTYQIINFHPFLTSPAYKQVVVLGARQSGLPLAYIRKLEAVETNGYQGPSILDQIEGIEAA